MKLITSWLKFNRTLGVAVTTTAIFCALLAVGKTPSTKNSSTTAVKQTPPKIMAPSLPKIALVAADSSTFADDVQSKLVATGRFSQVDIIDASSTTPTVDQLRAYKSVLVWSDNTFADRTTLGNNLADYVDGGGGVVIAVFANSTASSNIFEVGGRFASDDYFVITPASHAGGTELTLGTVYEPASPLMNGVTTFDGGTSSYHINTSTLNANATRVADWSNGQPLIARRTINKVRRVDLNFFPPSSDAAPDFWKSSTDGVTIMANALEFVGLASCDSAPAGMVSWWKAEGNANDSQDSHNGTVNDATFAPGEVGQAFTFDGTDDSVSIPSSSDWNFGTGDFTFDFWEKSSASSETREYALSFDPVQDTTNLEFNFNDSNIGLWVYWNGGGGPLGTNAIQVGTGGQYTDGQWHHIALTRSGSTLTLYIDGVAVGTATYSDPIDLSGGNNNYLGKYAGNNFFWNGQIDEVEIFKRGLTGTEVARIFNAGSNGKCPCTPAPDGMISWWPGDNNTDDVQDSNNGTWNGTSAYGSGEVRQAFSFDGNSANYVSIGNPSNLKPTDGITLDAWINLNAVDGDGRAGIITKWGQGSEDNWAIWAFQGEGNILLNGYIVTTAGQSGLYGASIPIGAWTHVAMTYDAASGTQTLYINGVSVATTTLPPGSTLVQTNAEVCIGRECTSNPRPFNGFIDEVEVFDRALTAPEIAALYDAGGAGKCRSCTSAPAGMVGWWRGNGNTNDEIAHNDGALQGGATFGAGEVDQGFSLDGSDDSVTVDQTPNSSNEITLDAWINPSTLNLDEAVGPVVFEKGVDIFNRIGMQIKTDGSLCGYLNSDVLNVCSARGRSWPVSSRTSRSRSVTMAKFAQ
jgi:Concanavalin A-like lectin/glucanases superfamily